MTEIPDTEKDAPKLSDFLCFALYSAHHAMHRINKSLLDDLGLTYPQFLVLVILWESDDQLVSDIGKKLFLESNTLTPLLKRLEALGHIQRNRDAEDERKVRVTLTSSGRELQNPITCFPSTILEASGLDSESFQELTQSITKLRESLMSYPEE